MPGRHRGFGAIGARVLEQHFPASLGEVASLSDTEAKFKVARSKIPEAAASILKNLPVADLSIEDADIADIIGKLLHEKNI